MKELKVFIIDSEQAIRTLFEELYCENAYTLEGLDDVSFRLPDFGPNLVILGVSLFNDEPQKALELLELASDIPLVLLGFEEEVAKARELGWNKATFLKPLQVGTLKEDLGKLYSQL